MVQYPTFPHPDLIQTETWEVADDTRYHFVPGSVYLLGARLIYKAGESDAKDASARLFTTEDPDNEEADDNRCVVDLVNSRDQTSPHVFFEHGIYVETFTGDALEGAYLELSWVKRMDYCQAYWRTEDALQECWKQARGDEPFLDNFWRGNEDDTIWSGSGTPGSGTGGSDPEFLDTIFRIQDDGDPTKEIAFEASSISTGTTRTITMPDNDVDLSDSGISASYQNINPSPLSNAMRIGTDSGVGEMSPSLVAASVYQEDTSDPASAPDREGLIFVNTSSGDIWISKGTSVVGDWVQVNGGGGGTVDVVSNVATARILGRTTAGSGDSEELTVDDVLGMLAIDEVGAIVAGNASSGSTITKFIGPCDTEMDVTAVYICTQASTTSSGANNWDIQIQNKDNSNADLLATAYNTDTDGDLPATGITDLGAVHGTAANLVWNRGDRLQVVWTENGSATNLFGQVCWVLLVGTLRT